MSNYNAYFEIASIFFLVLILLLVSIKRQLDIVQNKIFYWGIVLMLFLNIVDALSANLINYESIHSGQKVVSIYIHWGLSILTFLIQQILVQLFLVYVTIATRDIGEKAGLPFYILSCISIVYYILILSTPFTKWIFFFDEQGAYQYGPLHSVLHITPAIFGLYACIRMLLDKKRFGRMQKIYVVIFAAILTIGTLLQVIFLPNYLIIYFLVTIILTAVFFTLHSPDYYLDKTTMAFNHEGLMVMINERITRSKPFSVLFLSICDFENIKDGFSAENKKHVYSRLCQKLFKIPKTDVFREEDRLYILFNDTSKAEKYDKMVEGWLKDGIKVEGMHEPVKIVAEMLSFDFPGRIHTVEEFNSIIKYFVMGNYYKSYNVLQFINEEFFQKKKRYEDVRRLIEEAIRTDGVEIFYQPIYSTQKDTFLSAEALVRLKDRQTIGFVSPEEFIPIAEKEHLILQLENIILREICRFVKQERLQDYGLEYIEVNLSGNQCMQTDLYEQLHSLIEEYEISPGFINFEVTETSAIDNSECLIQNMQQLLDYGASFALDDYGSGCSNLQYLVEFPFEIVKLDKEIVWTYFGKGNQKVKSVLPLSVNMLHDIDVRIVAEGVETEEQKDELIRMGVQYLQGYYFSKPISEQEFIQFLKKHNSCV
ncbi:MAG: EAL domain-containing protein [Lachnospiraceae bacterium]|nr:EAL domain-containing protein [Lachnospiraceae bacterium]